MPADGWNVPQEELETLARAIGLPAVGGSWPAARHKARVQQFQLILDGGRPDGWDGIRGVNAPSPVLPARPAAAVAATHAEVDGDDDDEDDEEDTARCKEMFGMASQQPWSNSQRSGTALDEQLSATQPFEDSQSYSQGYSQGYSQELDGDDNGDERAAADTQRLSQASTAETLPYEMSQSLSQRLSDVEDEDEDEDGGTRSPILGDDVSDDDELFGPRASQSLSPSPPPKPPRLPTPIPVHGHTAARSPSVGRASSDTPASAPGTRSPPLSGDRADDPTPGRPLQRIDSNGAKAATAALGPRGPFALAAAAAARARSHSASRSPSVGASPTPPVMKPCPVKAVSSNANPAAKPKPAARRASGRAKTKVAGAASDADVSAASSTTGTSASEPSATSNQGTLDSFLVRKRKPLAQPPPGSRLQDAVGLVRSASGQTDTPPPQGAGSEDVPAILGGGASNTHGDGGLSMGLRMPEMVLPVAAALDSAAAATSQGSTGSQVKIAVPGSSSQAKSNGGCVSNARGGRQRNTTKAVGFRAPRRLSEVQQVQQLPQQQQARVVDPRCSSTGDDTAPSPPTKRPRRSARR